MIAVQQAKSLPAGRDVLQTDAAVIPGIQLRLLAVTALRTSGVSGGGRTRSPRADHSRSSASSSAARGGSRGAAVKKLALFAVATTAGLLEEATHRQPASRLMRKRAGVSELALALWG